MRGVGLVFDNACMDVAATVDRVAELEDALESGNTELQRARCMAQIQDQAAQLALELLVTQPDVAGFFAGFTHNVAEQTEAHACAVWLLDEEAGRSDLWLAQMGGRLFTADQDGWDDLALPREAMSAHLFSHRAGWKNTVIYEACDSRLPEALHAFNTAEKLATMIVTPMNVGSQTLGWLALTSREASGCERGWQAALLEAVARQATLVLHQSRIADQLRQEDRRKAVLEERTRLARDIHDILAQGFGAILMQLQAAQRERAELPPRVAGYLDAAISLARTHLVEARRSVGVLRPPVVGGRDITAGLRRLTETARLSSSVPIELVADTLPTVDSEIEREIIGIAQEALTNATRHARARQITVSASAQRTLGLRLLVADDGRGIASDRAAGFGMASMQERADRIGASLTIVTAPRAGTQVVLAWEPPAAGQ
jgi:signal transduction histidine kinase